jgi:hypothetical protein
MMEPFDDKLVRVLEGMALLLAQQNSMIVELAHRVYELEQQVQQIKEL